ncbi:hypothetical protein EsH8_VII_000148 [Colletotrichum jinshuiense]
MAQKEEAGPLYPVYITLQEMLRTVARHAFESKEQLTANLSVDLRQLAQGLRKQADELDRVYEDLQNEDTPPVETQPPRAHGSLTMLANVASSSLRQADRNLDHRPAIVAAKSTPKPSVTVRDSAGKPTPSVPYLRPPPAALATAHLANKPRPAAAQSEVKETQSEEKQADTPSRKSARVSASQPQAKSSSQPQTKPTSQPHTKTPPTPDASGDKVPEVNTITTRKSAASSQPAATTIAVKAVSSSQQKTAANSTRKRHQSPDRDDAAAPAKRTHVAPTHQAEKQKQSSASDVLPAHTRLRRFPELSPNSILGREGRRRCLDLLYAWRQAESLSFISGCDRRNVRGLYCIALRLMKQGDLLRYFEKVARVLLHQTVRSPETARRRELRTPALMDQTICDVLGVKAVDKKSKAYSTTKALLNKLFNEGKRFEGLGGADLSLLPIVPPGLRDLYVDDITEFPAYLEGNDRGAVLPRLRAFGLAFAAIVQGGRDVFFKVDWWRAQRSDWEPEALSDEQLLDALQPADVSWAPVLHRNGEGAELSPDGRGCELCESGPDCDCYDRLSKGPHEAMRVFYPPGGFPPLLRAMKALPSEGPVSGGDNAVPYGSRLAVISKEECVAFVPGKIQTETNAPTGSITQPNWASDQPRASMGVDGGAVLNIDTRHPMIMMLLHRVVTGDEENETPGSLQQVAPLCVKSRVVSGRQRAVLVALRDVRQGDVFCLSTASTWEDVSYSVTI